jgi:hypothetical protein
MFEIGFSAVVVFIIVALTVSIMDDSKIDKYLVYVTTGIGYGGLAIGFIIAALKWLFLAI